LHASFANIYEGIQALPDLPLYQIVGDKDWIVPLEAALVRRNEGYFHVIKNASHLNLLFHPDMYQRFPEFLRLAQTKEPFSL
jgi:pimeloyl-ACP methyl ester carboxylesterase